MFTEKVYQCLEIELKGLPQPGFHCHESCKKLEYFVWNVNQLMPCYVLTWKATLTGVVYDGS